LFLYGISLIGFFVFGAVLKFWAVLFIQKHELVVEILFFLLTGAPRAKKNRGGEAETVWSFVSLEKV